jgi:hypothetical membrane protein
MSGSELHKSKASMHNAIETTDVNNMLRKDGISKKGRPEWLRKVYGACGMLAPTVGLISLYDSVRDYAHFSWAHQAISDLFVGKGDPAITAGAIAAGLLTAGVSLGLYENLPKSRFTTAGATLLGIGGVSLAAMAVGQGKFEYLHDPMAVNYFVSSAVGLMTIGTGLLRETYKRALGAATVASGIGTLAVLSNAMGASAKAVPETVAASIIGTWIFCAGARLVLEKEEHKGQNAGLIRVTTKATP